MPGVGVSLLRETGASQKGDSNPDSASIALPTDIPKMNFLGQGFQTLEHYRQTDRHRQT